MRAFFLDRDGVLNDVVMRGQTVGSPRTLEEFHPIAEAVALVHGVRELGYHTFVVTNQPDVGRGLMDVAVLEEMHHRLAAMMPLDAVAVCTSGDDADPRRKPNPGMLLELAHEHGIALEMSYFLGDGVKDLIAGRRAGVGTLLLKREYNAEHSDRADAAMATHAEVLRWMRGRDESI